VIAANQRSPEARVTKKLFLSHYALLYVSAEQNDKRRLTAAVAIVTRSSATAEKQRVSYACLPRLANWSCNAQNTTESQRLYYFWHSNALIQEVLAENAFCYEIAAQGHSRSFTLQLFAGRQAVALAYHHILLLAVSL